jgi:hypothetical protein
VTSRVITATATRQGTEANNAAATFAAGARGASPAPPSWT